MKEYESDGPNGEIVNDAIFTRNSHVEGKLHVQLAWEKTPGNNGNKQSFASAVGNVYKSGDHTYDLISAYSRTTAICAENGYCAELTSLPYLDFSNPWWPEELVSVVSIDNKVYFASGDASINVLHFMYGVYYNKDIIANKNLPNPVELVDSNQWTIDKMIEMCEGLYEDKNQDNIKDKDDGYGLTTTNFHIDAFYTGSGLRLVEQDPDKILVISEDFWSEKADTLCTKLGDWFKTQYAFMGSGYEDNFVAGNTLFSNNRCYLADRKLGNVSFKFGIVPTPKYDADQENFISVVGNPFSLYAIFTNTNDRERAAAVLECWASEAYRTTTPAQYELNMKARYSEENDDSRMYGRDRVRVKTALERGIGEDQRILVLVGVLIRKTVAVFDERIVDAVGHHVHRTDAEHSAVHIVAVEHMVHVVVFFDLVIKDLFFPMFFQIFSRRDKEAGRPAGRIGDHVVRFRIHQLDHHFDNVARRSELTVDARRGDLGEQIFIDVAAHVGDL